MSRRTDHPFTDSGVTEARSSSSVRFEELEAYRGIAAIFIVVFHVYQYTQAGTGAESYLLAGTLAGQVLGNLQALAALFFVLSGLVIFLPFARAALEQSGMVSARGYLVRRAIRIVPAYYAIFILVWTFRYAGLPGQWKDVLLHLTFTQTFSSTYIFWTIGPAWALAVEVQFYLFLLLLGSLLYWLCSYATNRNTRVALVGTAVMLLGLGSLAYKWWATFAAEIPRSNYAVYFSLPAHLDSFSIGMLLALVVTARGDKPLLPEVARLPLLLLGFGGIVAHFTIWSPFSPYFFTVFSVPFALVLASTVLTTPRGSTWETWLRWRPVQALALVSYSLYLVHEPLMLELSKRNILISPEPQAFLLNVLFLLPLALLIATAVYWMVEYPLAYLYYFFDRRGRLLERYPKETEVEAEFPQ